MGPRGWSSAASDGGRQGLWLAQMDAFDWSCVEMRPAFALATEGFAKPLEAEALNRAAARYVKPFFLLESLKNNAFSFLANLFDLRGPNTSVSGYAGPSVVLLDLAARALLRDDLDRALVVGAGRAASAVARNDEALLGLRRAGPTPLPGPFDARGVGLAPGEAAAALCLGRPDGRTGADLLLAAVEASGAPRDDLPAPRGETARRAAAEALASARVGPEDLAFVVAPSLGVPDADRDVLEALASLPAVSGAPVVSWSGALGRLALADGLAEVVVALAALRRGAVPGTVGCREPLSVRARVALAPFEPRGKAALVLSSGRHGEVSAAVVTTGARVG